MKATLTLNKSTLALVESLILAVIADKIVEGYIELREDVARLKTDIDMIKEQLKH